MPPPHGRGLCLRLLRSIHRPCSSLQKLPVSGTAPNRLVASRPWPCGQSSFAFNRHCCCSLPCPFACITRAICLEMSTFLWLVNSLFSPQPQEMQYRPRSLPSTCLCAWTQHGWLGSCTQGELGNQKKHFIKTEGFKVAVGLCDPWAMEYKMGIRVVTVAGNEALWDSCRRTVRVTAGHAVSNLALG